ncbi:MAG: hypothetical protein HRU00_13725 [Myxococcales bacterium]|nr:hypothetical protein [Myxococcales bacterium]
MEFSELLARDLSAFVFDLEMWVVEYSIAHGRLRRPLIPGPFTDAVFDLIRV